MATSLTLQQFCSYRFGFPPEPCYKPSFVSFSSSRFHLLPPRSRHWSRRRLFMFQSGEYARRLCKASLISRDEKNLLLAGVDSCNIEVVARVLEQAKTAFDRWGLTHSDFLTPPVIDDALRSLKRLSDVGVVVSGGYPEAERCRISVGHMEALPIGNDKQDAAGYPGAVAALSVSGNFFFESAAHADFLGAVLSTGVSRDKIGDILVQGDGGAQILVVPELVDYLASSLKQVRNVPVTCTPLPLTALQAQPPRVKVIKSVEASLRVDALASAGFSMSRSKLADLISSGDVRVNWREVTKNGLVLKAGDMISVRGKGRVQLGEVATTRKRKYAVELVRYL